MKVIVTGCNGFIGKVLVSQLLDNGIDVLSLSKQNGFDVTDWKHFESLENFDIIIHLAAKSFVPDSYKDPLLYYNTNVIGTLNVLEICRIRKKKLIFISSYVYGVPQYLPIDEDHPVIAFNPYSQTKILAENLCKAYSRDFGVQVIILRPFNVYGPGQSKDFLLPTILLQAKNKKIILNDSRPKRDYIHVRDFSNAIIAALNFQSNELEIFNVGSGHSISIGEIANILKNKLGLNISVEFTMNIRPNEVLDTVSNNNRINSILNWYPTISFEDGMKEMAKSYSLL